MLNGFSIFMVNTQRMPSDANRNIFEYFHLDSWSIWSQADKDISISRNLHLVGFEASARAAVCEVIQVSAFMLGSPSDSLDSAPLPLSFSDSAHKCEIAWIANIFCLSTLCLESALKTYFQLNERCRIRWNVRSVLESDFDNNLRGWLSDHRVRRRSVLGNNLRKSPFVSEFLALLLSLSWGQGALQEIIAQLKKNKDVISEEKKIIIFHNLYLDSKKCNHGIKALLCGQCGLIHLLLISRRTFYGSGRLWEITQLSMLC